MLLIKFDTKLRYKNKSGKFYGKGVWYRDSNDNNQYDAGDILIRLGNRIKNSDGSYVQLNSDGTQSILFKNGKASKGVSNTDKLAMANGLIYGTKAINGLYVNYWTGNVLNEYNEDLNNLPKGIEGDRLGNLYYPNGKPYGRVVKHTDGSSGFYKFLSAYKWGGKTKNNYSSKFKFGGTMKLIAKALKGLSFKAAFNKARNNGDRIFWYKGKTYNTMTSKEQNNSKLRELWALTHRDNSTSGGSNNVQTDIGLSGGWLGVKGANAGRFDSKGNWVRLTLHSDAPVAVRGDNVTQYLDYAPIDKPTDKISTYTYGTDRNQFSTNKTTGLIVGNPYIVSNPKKVEYNSFMGNRQYGGNEDITLFSPWGFPGGPGTYVVSPITPGYSLERSPELVPPQVSFEPQTPEQILEFAKTIGIDPKYISGDRQITITAKRKK